MRRPLALLVAAIVALPLTVRADRSYTASATHDCATEREVSINASGATFTFTGTCDKISVNGSGNKVVVAAVKKIALNGSKNVADVGATDKIAVNGSENVVTYVRGLSKAKPKVGGVGANNRVTKK